MALDIIRERVERDYNALHLLDSLPSHDSMTWLPFPNADPPTALVIGTDKGRNTLAFLAQHGDKPREVRYCSIPVNGTLNSSTIHSVSQDEVMSKSLKAPFSYNAGQSKACKRKSSIVLKWYFMLKGLWTDGIAGDYVDYCKRFYDALRKIDAGQKTEKQRHSSRSRFDGSYAIPMFIEESPEPDEPRTVYGLCTSRTEETADAATPATSSEHVEQLATPADTPFTRDKGGNPDYDKLCQYLESYGALYLLQNIPDADGLQFVDQGFMPEAQPKKLFIGRHAKNEGEIYAYMRPNRKMHEINYWVEDPHRPLHVYQMRAEDVAKQRILHPFNKTYPKDSRPIDQGDRARFSLMVKWYFIAAGIVKDVVLQETKAYPERLRSALEYIAARMGPAAVQPPDDAEVNGPSNTRDSNGSANQQSFNESQIQSDLAAPPQPSPQKPGPALPEPSPRGKKRSAEDTHFEILARTLEQDRTLTKQINNADAELELLDIEKHNFLTSWEQRHKEVMDRRMSIDGRRTLVRKQFKRQSMAGMGEDGGASQSTDGT